MATSIRQSNSRQIAGAFNRRKEQLRTGQITRSGEPTQPPPDAAPTTSETSPPTTTAPTPPPKPAGPKYFKPTVTRGEKSFKYDITQDSRGEYNLTPKPGGPTTFRESSPVQEVQAPRTTYSTYRRPGEFVSSSVNQPRLANQETVRTTKPTTTTNSLAGPRRTVQYPTAQEIQADQKRRNRQPTTSEKYTAFANNPTYLLADTVYGREKAAQPLNDRQTRVAYRIAQEDLNRQVRQKNKEEILNTVLGPESPDGTGSFYRKAAKESINFVVFGPAEAVEGVGLAVGKAGFFAGQVLSGNIENVRALNTQGVAGLKAAAQDPRTYAYVAFGTVAGGRRAQAQAQASTLPARDVQSSITVFGETKTGTVTRTEMAVAPSAKIKGVIVENVGLKSNKGTFAAQASNAKGTTNIQSQGIVGTAKSGSNARVASYIETVTTKSPKGRLLSTESQLVKGKITQQVALNKQGPKITIEKANTRGTTKTTTSILDRVELTQLKTRRYPQAQPAEPAKSPFQIRGTKTPSSTETIKRPVTTTYPTRFIKRTGSVTQTKTKTGRFGETISRQSEFQAKDITGSANDFNFPKANKNPSSFSKMSGRKSGRPLFQDLPRPPERTINTQASSSNVGSSPSNVVVSPQKQKAVTSVQPQASPIMQDILQQVYQRRDLTSVTRGGAIRGGLITGSSYIQRQQPQIIRQGRTQGPSSSSVIRPGVQTFQSPSDNLRPPQVIPSQKSIIEQIPRQDIIPRQNNQQLPRQDITPAPTPPPPIVITVTPPPRVPPQTPFSGFGGGPRGPGFGYGYLTGADLPTGANRRRNKRAKGKYSYGPSLQAILLNIRGKVGKSKTKSYSGQEIRPIPILSGKERKTYKAIISR